MSQVETDMAYKCGGFMINNGLAEKNEAQSRRTFFFEHLLILPSSFLLLFLLTFIKWKKNYEFQIKLVDVMTGSNFQFPFPVHTAQPAACHALSLL